MMSRPRSVLSHPRMYLVSWSIVLLALPVAVPLLVLLGLYRAIVRVLARRAGLVGSLTPYDCIFAVDSYHTRPFASNLTVLELGERVAVDSIRSQFKSKILDEPRFSKLSCVPVEFGGYWFWRKLENIDLDSAVRVTHDSELDEEGGKSVDECLREIVEMPFTKELFNVCIIHAGGRSLLVFRIHHTVCDGYSFNKLVDRFVGMESKYLVKQSAGAGKNKTLNFIIELVKETVKWVHLVAHLPLHLSTLYKDALTHTPNFYTLRKESTTGQIRRTVLPLSKMKQIRRSTSSHFATVGMSLMTGALEKLFDESRPCAASLRPDKLSIMHSLPKPNHPLTHLCNHWGVGLFKVPFCRDAVARVYGAEEDFNEYMGLQFDRLIHLHMPVIGIVPCAVVKWFFSINFGTSCGFTSVPGLFDKVAYVGGSGGRDSFDGGVVHGDRPVEVSHMWKVFGLQWRQTAVAVAMYTYRGEASVSIYANRDIVPDSKSMDRLLTLFHEEFNELTRHSADPPPVKDPKLITTNGVNNHNNHHPASEETKRPVSNGGGDVAWNSSSPLTSPTLFSLEPCFRNNKLA